MVTEPCIGGDIESSPHSVTRLDDVRLEGLDEETTEDIMNEPMTPPCGNSSVQESVTSDTGTTTDDLEPDYLSPETIKNKTSLYFELLTDVYDECKKKKIGLDMYYNRLHKIIALNG